jgi:hypothetical protein
MGMSESKFTPGPWTPGPWTIFEHAWHRVGVYGERCPVAVLDIENEATEETQDMWTAVMDANARLIAAVPEFYETLRLIEMETRDGGQWGLRDVHEVVVAALAKVDA